MSQEQKNLSLHTIKAVDGAAVVDKLEHGHSPSLTNPAPPSFLGGAAILFFTSLLFLPAVNN